MKKILQKIKHLPWLTVFSVVLLAYTYTACNTTKVNPWESFLDFQNGCDTAIIIPETFCFKCIQYNISIFENGRVFKERINGFYITEDKNQYISNQLTDNYIIKEYAEYPNLKLSDLYIYQVYRKENKIHIDSIESSEFVSLINELSENPRL